ncbi:diaminopimelate decarboxylase [Rarobacter faecitabidus]|uniref:Diaminopimelate decarboxylase n=1 Tax=Rarobacter faecitabidus TaxID=13243 RepID=A0A542ZX79_RARFA|nr:diaminopimelate decarboxylase [Rarobacter faecitabidus]TQL64957.1 diaminopimelate decarboxylase [Rarobacter faecitabidus]
MTAESARIWPRGTRLSEAGSLVLGEHDVRDLAENFGTPLFVLNEDDFRARARLFRDSFGAAFADIGSSVDVYYAGKSFLCTAIAKIVVAEGLRLDTCTGGELAVAARAGVPGAKLGLHGNNKSLAEIERAIEMRVGRIVIDSLDEIDLIADVARRAGRRVPVMVRVTTGVHAGGHEYISTAHEDQKFGLSLADGGAVKAIQKVLGLESELELLGIHTHIGSQIQDAAAFVVSARKLLSLRAQIRDKFDYLLPEIDLGGGFGIAYTIRDEPIDVPALAHELAGSIDALCTEMSMPVPRVSIEPGRSIVGPSTVTLYRVGVVKPVTVDDGDTKVRTYVSVDGGMSDNIRPALYGAEYSAKLANRASSKVKIRSRIVGKHCESGDIVIPDIDLPADISRGDLIAVPATGAYGRSMASNYNLVTRPAVVAIRGGEARVIVRRETEEDLLATDVES